MSLLSSWIKVVLATLLLGRSCTATDIAADSRLGRKLLSRAQPVDGQQHRLLDENGYSFLYSYAIKFQGCHHVQQWNEDVDEDNDVRIMTKRLARFRLCPSDQCSNEKSVGCTSKYGDYIVDMDTFVEAYLEAMEEVMQDLCEQVNDDCGNYCGEGDDNYQCLYQCYDGYEATACLNENEQNDNGGEEFDVQEYAQCAEFELPDNYYYNNNYDNGEDYYDDYNNNNGGNRRRRRAEQQVQYYIGAYCADQGGEVRLGVFTDDTCTTFVNNGATLFYNAMGYKLPYSQDSLISTRCLNCAEYDNDNNGNYELREVCSNTYAVSGKCETRMSIDYPNESSCNYIEGVKIIRQDGVIRTSTTRKSKAAAVAIGVFTTLSVLLAAYVYYLRTKLARAQINLAAAAHPLN